MLSLDILKSHLLDLTKLITINDIDALKKSIYNIFKNMFDKSQVLGLDIDGTIDQNIEFFSQLSNMWPGEVIILTMRQNISSIKEYLDKIDIHYDQIITVSKLSDKAELIKKHNIKVYFEDQDECITNIDQEVTVFKVRNGGNFTDGKWLYSSQTGKKI